MWNHESQTDQPSNATRRKILKGSALALGAATVAPATWRKPIVDKLIVPAHAQASIAAGVYSQNGDGLISWNWPGGAGPTEVQVFEGTSASGTLHIESATLIVAAADSTQAGFTEVDGVTPALPGGLAFFVDNADIPD